LILRYDFLLLTNLPHSVKM